jgi:hypothetical protein
MRRKIRGLGQFSPPDYFDAGWASVFVAGCQALGVDPSDAAALIIGESSWTPTAKNSIGCVGLNQLCGRSQNLFTNQGYSVSDYLALPVSQQLTVGVFPYWTQMMQNAGLSSISGRDLYWLNWVPALYVAGSSDSYVIQNQGDPYYSADLDIGGKGYITAGDLQIRLDNMRANNPDLWSYLQGQIYAAGGILPSTTTMVWGGLITGIISFFAWRRFHRA